MAGVKKTGGSAKSGKTASTAKGRRRAAKVPTRTAVKGVTRKAAKGATRKVARGATGKASRGAARKAGKKVGREVARHPGRQAAKPAAMARSIIRIRDLDPYKKCGAGTSVERLVRVDEMVDRRLEAHLVFLDRHGWYCEHGRSCHAVGHARKHKE